MRRGAVCAEDKEFLLTSDDHIIYFAIPRNSSTSSTLVVAIGPAPYDWRECRNGKWIYWDRGDGWTVQQGIDVCLGLHGTRISVAEVAQITGTLHPAMYVSDGL